MTMTTHDRNPDIDICEFMEVIAPGEFRISMRREAGRFKERIERFRELKWRPAPRDLGEEPLVWIHEDGSWGLSEEGCSGSPESYWWEAKRIRTMKHLLAWLVHLSEKPWLTARHVNQMVRLFYKLHPEADVRPLP